MLPNGYSGSFPVTWYVVTGTNPRAQAAEPGAAGADVPDSILDWASGHGLNESDPDVYLLVSTEPDGAGEVRGLIASMSAWMPEADARKVGAAIDEAERERSLARIEAAEDAAHAAEIYGN